MATKDESYTAKMERWKEECSLAVKEHAQSIVTKLQAGAPWPEVWEVIVNAMGNCWRAGHALGRKEGGK